MNNSQQLYEIALSKIKGIGIKHAKYILAKTNLFSFFKDPIYITHKKTGLSFSFLQKINFKLALEEAEKELEILTQKKISYLFFNDAKYPYRLKECDDCPIVLYHYGKSEINPSKIVSIVGSRKASVEGKAITRELIYELAKLNVTVVSGLAYGIDIAAHQACLENKTPTFAVMGHGFDHVYPYAHKKTLNQIADLGKVFSEHPPNIAPQKFFFPKRNRIIAGLSDATIVVESTIKGGSIITAKLANEYNRDVFAFPGNVTSSSFSGCNKLIQNNQAHLLTNGADLLNFLGWEKEKKNKSSFFKKKEKLNDNEISIYNVFKEKRSACIREVYMNTKLSVPSIQSGLMNLELMNLIESVPGQRYLLK